MATEKTYRPDICRSWRQADGKLPVSEIFHTIQGEGRWSGTPSVFVRLMYCNLGCAWCDSRHTWDNSSLDEPTTMDVDELLDRLARVLPAGAKATGPVHLVISGGEPMLHQHTLPALIRAANALGLSYVEIETNGTIRPSSEMLELVDWWNCSPKLSSSGIDGNLRIRPDAIGDLVRTGKADFLFVVRDGEDIAEMRSSYANHIPSDRIWLMPEGHSIDDHLQRSREVVEHCLRTGYRLALRSHIFFWNNERGK